MGLLSIVDHDPAGRLLLVKQKDDFYGLRPGDLVVCCGFKEEEKRFDWAQATADLDIYTSSKKITKIGTRKALDSLYSIVEFSGNKPLAGKKFAITGELRYIRDYYVKLIEFAGGAYSASVTNTTTHLITDSIALTTKMKVAKEKGVKIISSVEMMAMINAS